MADNRTLQSTTLATLNAGDGVALYEVTFSGDANQIAAPAVLALVSGAEGARTLTEVSAANPVPVTATDLDIRDLTSASDSVQVFGLEGSTQRQIAVNASGQLIVVPNGATFPVSDGSGSLTVDGTVTVTDGGATISVDDGAGALTVDGTVAATQSGTWTARLQDGSGNALTSKAPGSERALSVAIVDTAGAHMGAMTEYTEGDTVASGGKGTNLVFRGAANEMFFASTTAGFPVNIVSGAGAGGTSQSGGGAYATNTALTPIGGHFNDAASPTLSEDTIGMARMTSKQAVHVNLRDNSGAELSVGGGTQYDRDVAATAAAKLTMAGVVQQDTLANDSPVDGDNTWLKVNTLGELYVRTNTTLLEDTVHSSGDPGVMALGVVRNTASAAAANGDYAAFSLEENGGLRVGTVAHDAAITGSPTVIGFRANANEPANVSTDADGVWGWADLRGRQVVVDGHPNPEAPVTVNATASGDSTVIAATGDAATRLVVRKGIIVNRDATNVLVTLTDGGGGTARLRAEVAAEGGTLPFNFGSRGWMLTANTALVANLGAASNVDVNVMEYSIEATT